MKELVESIAKALVDNPEQVEVRAVEGQQVTVLELKVHPEDLGKVIGRQGRTAKSIRTILGAAGGVRVTTVVVRVPAFMVTVAVPDIAVLPSSGSIAVIVSVCLPGAANTIALPF